MKIIKVCRDKRNYKILKEEKKRRGKMYSVKKFRSPWPFNPNDEVERRAYILEMFEPGYYTIYQIGGQNPRLEYFMKDWVGINKHGHKTDFYKLWRKYGKADKDVRSWYQVDLTRLKRECTTVVGPQPKFDYKTN